MNLEIERSGGGGDREREMSSLRGRGERNSSIVEVHKNTKVERGASKNKWTNINEELALRKLLTGNKNTELRNLGTLEYKIKCKWENQLKKII
jgi:hypothetical protein